MPLTTNILYDRDQLSTMRGQVDLFEYASLDHEFVKRGNAWFINCPLHVDKTPSLAIDRDKNRFHCFSCGITGDIFQWMIVFEGLSFQEAVQKVSKMTGMNLAEMKTSKTLAYMKSVNKLYEPKIALPSQRIILPSNTMDKYKREYPEEWLKEGITESEMDKYGIRIDAPGNRIVYPMLDKNDNIIGVKGRTRYENYKLMGLQKYQNYYKIGTHDFFVGMKQAREYVEESGEVIIFEGIKSVMIADSWGYHNCVATETSFMSKEQIELLLEMKVKDVVIAYDSDVDLHKILNSVALLRRFCNVYIIRDLYQLLAEKMSPVDKGKDVFDYLYERRMKL